MSKLNSKPATRWQRFKAPFRGRKAKFFAGITVTFLLWNVYDTLKMEIMKALGYDFYPQDEDGEALYRDLHTLVLHQKSFLKLVKKQHYMDENPEVKRTVMDIPEKVDLAYVERRMDKLRDLLRPKWEALPLEDIPEITIAKVAKRLKLNPEDLARVIQLRRASQKLSIPVKYPEVPINPDVEILNVTGTTPTPLATPTPTQLAPSTSEEPINATVVDQEQEEHRNLLIPITTRKAPIGITQEHVDRAIAACLSFAGVGLLLVTLIVVKNLLISCINTCKDNQARRQLPTRRPETPPPPAPSEDDGWTLDQILKAPDEFAQPKTATIRSKNSELKK